MLAVHQFQGVLDQNQLHLHLHKQATVEDESVQHARVSHSAIRQVEEHSCIDIWSREFFKRHFTDQR